MHTLMAKRAMGKGKKTKEVGSNRLSVVAFRTSGTGVRASTPSLLACPPPSPTAHGHLQESGKRGKYGGETGKKLNVKTR